MVFGVHRAYTARPAERVYVHNGQALRRPCVHRAKAPRAAQRARQRRAARAFDEVPTPLRTAR